MAGEKETLGISSQQSVHDGGDDYGSDRLARLEAMAKSQTAVLRKSFVSKVSVSEGGWLKWTQKLVAV